MKINHHNYEEYFILYMDNELAPEDRRMVEDFVQLHPHLKEELNFLLQYKLLPDENIVYPAKEELIQPNGGNTINLANYEEWFVRYIDEELSPEQRIEAEQFIQDNSFFKKELDLLAKTRLQPEEIVFPDKSSLYRKEENVRPFVARWWRIAAAAVLILGIGVATFSILNKRSGNISKDNMAKKVVPENNINEPVLNPESQKPDDIIIAQTPLQNNLKEENSDNSSASAAYRAGNKSSNEIIVADNNSKNKVIQPAINPEQRIEIPVIADNNTKNQPSNNLPVPDENPYIKLDQPKNAIAQNNSKESVNPENKNVTNKSASPSDIKQASYNDNDVAFDQPDGKKNKLRGFFRKLTRTFEKRTDIDPTDDDKLLVAGLAIKLK